MYGQELLRIYVCITDVREVQDEKAIVKMVDFTGFCRSNLFNGKIIHGATDRQIVYNDGKSFLSARYIMEGRDFSGKECRIFVENDAVVKPGERTVTKPKIYTDSEMLRDIFAKPLYGEMGNEEGQIVIRIKEGEENEKENFIFSGYFTDVSIGRM